MTDITIPPEARHAARAVIGDHVPSDTIDRAIRAALNAWPGMTYAKWRDYGQADRVVLPVHPPSLQKVQTIDGRNT